MSASPMARQATENKAIPTRNVYINDPNELPAHYSSTPGGTLYSTTPGGTKIVYEKSFLMNLRNSPISKTPPSYGIPDHLIKGQKNYNTTNNRKQQYNKPHNVSSKIDDHQEQFHMDM